MNQSLAHRRVLVADDEPSVAEVVTRQVQSRFGCQTVIAGDGDEVLRVMNEQRFDVLITDMLMPGCHGLDLVAKVARMCPETAIIVTTAYEQEFPYVDVIRNGASDFIAKPYEADVLVAKLMRIFRERQLWDELAQEKQRIVEDMEAMRKLREAQMVAEEKYRSLFEYSMNGMLVVSPDEYVIRDVNRSFCALSRRDRSDLIGLTLLELFDSGSSARLRQGFSIVEKLGQATLSDILLSSVGGGGVCLDVSANMVRTGAESMLHVACRDVTEQRELQRQLAEIAHTDQLTGLLNKRTFNTRMEGAIARSARESLPVCLLFIDIDNFKHCNDSFGHPAGDALLKLVGQIIQKHTRSSGDEAFRYGGDEFAILLWHADAQAGRSVAERIREEYSTSECQGTSMSVGVAELTAAMDVVDFVKCADQALYRAKEAGKNRICVVS
ncbi:MAG: diguanylate cyclase [Candidatus Hydrogenedentales bacterium]|jgi:diguanylate cyclase (GGDEF)-like protein/PAS domain S-box-containing protein